MGFEGSSALRREQDPADCPTTKCSRPRASSCFRSGGTGAPGTGREVG